MKLENFKKQFSFANLSLILTIFLFFFLRFYNLPKRIGFDWDQETLSFQLEGIIRNHDLILIGHRATDAMGFYFGPYFEYMFVPFYYISNLHPLGFIPFLLLVNTLFLIVTFYVISRIFNKYISTAFLFLWAVNPILVTYDITIWAPLLMPLGYVLTIFLLWKIYKNPSYLNFALLGIILGLFTQIHSLFFLINVFVGVFLIVDLYKKKTLSREYIKKIFLMISVFLVFFIPLIIFDIKYDFLNSKLFIGYFSHRAQGASRIWASLEVFSNFLKPFVIKTGSLVGLSVFVVILSLFLHLSYKRKGFLQLFYISSTFILLLTAFIFMKYSERPSEYYFLYLYPFISLAIFDFLYEKKRLFIALLCALFFLINVPQLRKVIKPNLLGLNAKERTVLLLKSRVGDKPINLSYEMPLGLNTGYDYLLKYHKLNIKNDENHPLVILRYPAKQGDIHVNKIGIVIPIELQPQD